MKGPSEPPPPHNRRTVQNRLAKQRERERKLALIGHSEARRLWRDEKREQRASQFLPIVLRDVKGYLRLTTARAMSPKRFASLDEVTDYLGVAPVTTVPSWVVDTGEIADSVLRAARGSSLKAFSEREVAALTSLLWSIAWRYLGRLALSPAASVQRRASAREARRIVWQLFPSLTTDVASSLRRLCAVICTPGFLPFESDLTVAPLTPTGSLVIKDAPDSGPYYFAHGEFMDMRPFNPGVLSGDIGEANHFANLFRHGARTYWPLMPGSRSAMDILRTAFALRQHLERNAVQVSNHRPTHTGFEFSLEWYARSVESVIDETCTNYADVLFDEAILIEQDPPLLPPNYMSTPLSTRREER